jgi:deoxyribodipyrimidine photo-lyase
MSNLSKPVLVWFRQDLRLGDNPALINALSTGHPVIPLFILDDINCGEWKMGAASRWWLHQSLSSLDENLDNSLCLAKGDPLPIITEIIAQTGARAVFWNRCYEPWRIKRDSNIKKKLRETGIEVKSFNAGLLFEPHEALKPDGTAYRVFTPFYKKGCIERNGEPPMPTPFRHNLNLHTYKSLKLSELSLMPSVPWHKSIAAEWHPGEKGGQKRLEQFVEGGLDGYKDGRNFPATSHVSRLSPHLHFGEISPRQAWHAAKAASTVMECEEDGAHFLSELGWREFSNNLLYHFPKITHENFQSKFDAFPWRKNKAHLQKWQQGQTGYPIVDAGMRELWQTGYMHNRVRMIVGSFLVKNLLIHWHHGAKWFWETLVDADLANNSASWQWIAGSGADAAPYFRIFNPVTQGKKFDTDGQYVRRFVPELAGLHNKYIHGPWLAKPEELQQAGISLGIDYPKPIVNLKQSRDRALAAFKTLSPST